MLLDKVNNLYTDFQNDPETRKKIIFYGASIATFVILISLLLFLSSINNDNTDETLDNNVSDAQIATQFVNIEFGDYNQTIDVKSTGIIGVNKTGKFIYKDLQEYSGLNIYPDTTNVVVNYHDIPENESALINTYQQDVYFFEKGEIKKYPENILNISPVEKDSDKKGFYTVKQVTGGISLEISDKIDLSENITPLDTIEINSYDYTEIITHNEKPYILIWNGNTLNILTLQNNELISVQFIDNIYSVQRGEGQIIYNSIEGSKNTVYIIDFTENANGAQYTTSLQEKSYEKDIEGLVFANRCDFLSQYEIVCLVKEKSIKPTDTTVVDRIIKYNYVTEDNSILFDNLQAASNRIYVNNGSIYVLEASQKIIYELK